MASGWSTYYILFLTALILLALLGLPLLLRAGSLFLVPRKLTSKNRAQEPWAGRLNIRFYLPIVIISILIIFSFSTIPVASSLARLGEVGDGLRLSAVAIMIMGLLFTSLGLFYAVKKGDLSWYRKDARSSESIDSESQQ